LLRAVTDENAKLKRLLADTMLDNVVPTDLLRPCTISDRVAETYRDLAILASEHLNSARCGNDKIGLLAKIVGPQ
jgi:hypothetical protein